MEKGRSAAAAWFAAAIGAVLGFVVGANIGGNWFTSAHLGQWHGYEATAMIGAVVGAVAAGVTGLLLSQRRGRHEAVTRDR
jgi:hypothetical protein